MADVTDAAFRRVIAKYGKPDVMWTEFVSADGLVRADAKGKKRLLKNLIYTESERPIVAQLFSSHPGDMEKAARLCAKLGFDGIDINMGCPDKTIEKQGAGAALMKNPDLALEVLLAAKRGAGKIPVSVKTRVGYNKNDLETWLPRLLSAEPALITIHARTRKEMSKIAAHWEYVKRAVEIRNEFKSETLIVGNGDVKDLEDAHRKAEETGADGIMLGRAIFGNPWLFSSLKNSHPSLRSASAPFKGRSPSSELSVSLLAGDPSLRRVQFASERMGDVGAPMKLKVLLEHTKLFEKLFKGVKSFAVMKKHFKAYVNGFDGASELRSKLMETANAKEVEKIIKNFIK